MNKQQTEWLNNLDKEKQYGTLQTILSENNVNIQPFEKVLMFLVQNLMIERETLMKENKKYVRVLKENGLYTNDLILGD